MELISVDDTGSGLSANRYEQLEAGNILFFARTPIDLPEEDCSFLLSQRHLHIDALPTRPTYGDRILRFFVNLNPERPRVWLTGDGFNKLAERFAASPFGRQLAKFGRAMHWPPFERPPYDAAMHRFHNFLKENEEFQRNGTKQRWEFPPGSSWLVFTDMVSHAVLAGQMALEQTFIIPRRQMLHPEQAPAAILERLAGVALT